MNIIYIHGLDSDANSTKGILLESYCQQHHADINVYRPDLNSAPAQVFEQLVRLVTELNTEDRTVLIGSSLGGYFSTLISSHTSCPVLLLNPSTQPHVTLQRFAKDLALKNVSRDEDFDSQIIHSTAGGWGITQADLQWFEAHQLLNVHYPNKVSVLIKEGDELLNPELSKQFYKEQGVTVNVQAGGDHRFSDFAEQLPMVIDRLRQLVQD